MCCTLVLIAHRYPSFDVVWLLVVLGLGRNNLGQTIPTEIGRLQNLITLGLERNSLTGSIPPEMGGMNNMSKFLVLLLVERSASRGVQDAATVLATR